MSNEFPFNFSNLASVGDVIKVTSHPSFEPRSYYVGTVVEKTGSCFRIGISEASIAGRPDGSAIGNTASIFFGMLDDWADRITLVKRGPGHADRVASDLRAALEGARQLIDQLLEQNAGGIDKDREIAKLQAQLVTQRAATESLQSVVNELQKQIDDMGGRLTTAGNLRQIMEGQLAIAERKALTVDMVTKQRDEALRELAAMRADRNKMLDQREFYRGQMEKAQADYRDLQSRVLKA